jgi:hypothetical protein
MDLSKLLLGKAVPAGTTEMLTATPCPGCTFTFEPVWDRQAARVHFQTNTGPKILHFTTCPACLYRFPVYVSVKSSRLEPRKSF